MEAEDLDCDRNLPRRLYATDRYPSNRLNVNSKLDTLTFLHQILRRSEAFEIIRNSPLGKLYDIPVVRCPISCKLIHGMLTRQLLTKQRYVLWSVLAGQPVRFSLKEFGEVTGLNCEEFPEDYDPNYVMGNDKIPEKLWTELFGQEHKVTLPQIGKMLQDEPGMSTWRKT